jgi:large subunit ribosomal protein L22
MASARAQSKYMRIAPRKVRLVADLIRGKKVSEARDILRFTVRGAAPLLAKLLDSAVANVETAAAEKHERVDPDDMVVMRILVHGGPQLRRLRPAPRGRGVRIRKRMSHVELLIADV